MIVSGLQSASTHWNHHLILLTGLTTAHFEQKFRTHWALPTVDWGAATYFRWEPHHCEQNQRTRIRLYGMTELGCQLNNRFGIMKATTTHWRLARVYNAWPKYLFFCAHWSFDIERNYFEMTSRTMKYVGRNWWDVNAIWRRKWKNGNRTFLSTAHTSTVDCSSQWIW